MRNPLHSAVAESTAADSRLTARKARPTIVLAAQRRDVSDRAALRETQRRRRMPTVKANGITMNYEQQGSGEPLLLIPYLAADHACYAFQVAEYAKHFTCISIDPRGAGASDKPPAPYSTELFADDIAALLTAIGVPRAHVSGLSLGAATGMWLAAKHPDKVKTLSLHSGWSKSDPFLKSVVGGWQIMAKGLDSVTEMVIQGIFPWCFTPELYAQKPDYIESLAAFVRGRPKQPLDAFLRQSNAVIAHDAEAQLGRITAPTQITFGRHDVVTSTRFANAMQKAIRGSELIVFEGCAHAPIYEAVDEFNQRTLAFLRKHSA
jgi:pimeloyl-ACP methyl ester carboxylesterase